MASTTKEEKLAEMRQRIDSLETQASDGTAETRARLQNKFDALRADADDASAAMDAKTDAQAAAVDEKFAALDTRVEAAEHRVSAELASDRKAFEDAAEAELHDWDAAIERLQARAASMPDNAREQHERVVAELRQDRNRAAESLAQTRASGSEQWEEQKTSFNASVDALEQKVRDTTAKYK